MVHLKPELVSWLKKLSAGKKPGDSMRLPPIELKSGKVFMDFPEMTRPVTAECLGASLSPLKGGELEGKGYFSLAGNRFSVGLDASNNMTEGMVQAKTQAMNLESLSAFQNWLPEPWRNIKLSGQMSGALQLHFAGSREKGPLFKGRGNFAGVDAEGPFLPAQLTDINGSIKFNSNSLSATNVTGQMEKAKFLRIVAPLLV